MHIPPNPTPDPSPICARSAAGYGAKALLLPALGLNARRRSTPSPMRPVALCPLEGIPPAPASDTDPLTRAHRSRHHHPGFRTPPKQCSHVL